MSTVLHIAFLIIATALCLIALLYLALAALWLIGLVLAIVTWPIRAVIEFAKRH